MVAYVLSAHAEVVIADRSIERAWLEQVLERPERVESDKVDPALKHAIRRISTNGGRVLRVVYNDTVDPRRIVTAYFDRTLRDKL